MLTSFSHPNFPHGLDIRPLVPNDERNPAFDAEIQQKSIQRFGIAGRIWEAAQLMVRYFDQALSSDWQFDPPCSMIHALQGRSDLTIVELGSGTGYVGLKLAEKLSKRSRKSDLLVLTDLPDVCPLLEENLYNARRRWTASHEMDESTLNVNIVPLLWGVTKEARGLSDVLSVGGNVGEACYLTHLVCSDLVYFPHLLAPLLRSLLQLTSPPFARPDKPPEIIISYKVRSLCKESAFWSAFGLWFTFFPVLFRPRAQRGARNNENEEVQGAEEKERNWRIFGPDAESGFVFTAYRRPGSYNWIVPDDDEELLSGVGAGGTQIPKGDDAFEVLLLMQVGINNEESD